MVKVLPIEGEAEGQATQPINDNNSTTTAVQQDDPPIGQPANPAIIAGASSVEEGQHSGNDVSDAAETEPGAFREDVSPPGSHTEEEAGVGSSTSNALEDPPKPSSASEEPPILVPGDAGSGVAGNSSGVAGISSQGEPSTTLDMDKHSGLTTFSLMRHSGESSLDGTPHTEREEDDENIISETLAEVAELEEDEEDEEDEEEEEEEEEPERAFTNFARRGTRKFVRQDTGIGIGDGMLASRGKKKKAPFHVPQTMYMGHPVGSPAAEFLERQQHRLEEVKTRREEVAGMLKLVMEHNPKSSGSDLPDLDAVFPDMRGSDHGQEDRCI